MNAVITADIIDYTKLTIEGEDMVLQAINRMINDQKSTRTNLKDNFTIRRGDSIQIELEQAEEALKVSLLLKTAVNKISLNQNNKTKPSIDIRIAIGIGEIASKREQVGKSSGDAYTLSGRTLDKMKKQKRTFATQTQNKKLGEELEVAFKLLEVIMSKWNIASAEVLYWLLMGLGEIEISHELGISQAAINYRKKYCGWSGIEPLLKRYKELIEQEPQEVVML